MLIESLIGAGASLLGNLFNKSSTEANNANQMAMAQANNATQLKIAEQNIALQKEFAQHGISWKVDDAKAAGLHPLIGAGAQAQSFSPVSVGSSMANTTAPQMDFTSLGQDLSRAAKAMSSEGQRAAVDAERERKLDLESKALDNALKADTLASRGMSTSRHGGQLGPSLPFGSGAIPIPHLSRAPLRTTAGDAVDVENPKQTPSDIPKYGRYRPAGIPLQANPYFSDIGGAVSDRLGDDVAEWLTFGPTVAADALYTIGQTDAWRDWSNFVNKRYWDNPFESRVASSPYRKARYGARYMGGPRPRAWGE